MEENREKVNSLARRVYKNNPEIGKKARVRRRFREYGITEEQRIDMIRKSAGHCTICKEPAPLVIDHCHGSGKVRGLLCNKCNTALGMFKDSTEILSSAIEYLEKSKKL
jgi:Fe2+ transport system protein FeoA